MNGPRVTARYAVEIDPRYSFEEGVEIIATEESIGIESISFADTIRIFPGITGLSPGIRSAHCAEIRVIQKHDEQSGIIDISFPFENFNQEHACLVSLLSTLIGDLFGIEPVTTIRLLQVDWPDELLTHFPGPRFGIDGVRGIVGREPPWVGVIIKPNLGLSPRDTAQLVFDLAMAGASFVKDDELMCSPAHSPVLARLGYVRDAIDRAAALSGRTCLYALNITADAQRLLPLAAEAVAAGAQCLMVNVFVAGFDALKALASDPSINVPIHTHRCMHDLFTSRGNYGVAPSVFAEIARMCGADFYHVGTPIGKPQKALAEMREAHASLTRSMGRFAPTVPVSSRVSPLSVANVLTAFDSTQLLLLACGAIYRLPYPVATGVAAIADALEAAALQQEASSEAYQQSTSYLTALSRAPNSREQ